MINTLAILLGGIGLVLLAAVTFGMVVSARRRGAAGRRYLGQVLPFQVAVLAAAALAFAAVAGVPRAAVGVAAVAWLALMALLAARALLRGNRRQSGS